MSAKRSMTTAEMRAAHPLLDSNPRRREYEAAKAERERVDSAAAPLVLAIAQFFSVCAWLREYSETFAEVMRPTGKRV